MMRAVVPALLTVMLCTSAALAQNEGQTTDSTPLIDAPAYDPTSFLEAMVNYRAIALTCEDTLPGSPMADSAEISIFFQTLGMDEPLTLNDRLLRLTKRLVRAQGASVCTERLQESATAYGRSAVDYANSKPEAWPDAPRISSGPWCRQVSCAELAF
jgi:hypothetical protein